MAVNKVVLGNETLVDLTSDTVSENTLLEGATAHAANGEQITGGVVVTPMYTGTKSAIESAITSGEIPDGAVVNITDDEETSSFQTQINEINNSLAWKDLGTHVLGEKVPLPKTWKEVAFRALMPSHNTTGVIPRMFDTTIYPNFGDSNYGAFFQFAVNSAEIKLHVAKNNETIYSDGDSSVRVKFMYR